MPDSTIEDEGHDFIDSRRVRSLCGGISMSMLWCWLVNYDFARPVYIGGRRYRSHGKVVAWLARHPDAPKTWPAPAGR